MARLDVHAPLTLRLVGQPTDEDWQRLEDALARRYARAFRLDRFDMARTAADALKRGEAAGGEPAFDMARLDGDGYLLPSYEGGGAPVRIPLRAGGGAGAVDDTLRLRWSPDPFDEFAYEDRGWWLVSGDFSRLPGLPEVRAAIVGHDGVTAELLAACTATLVRRSSPRYSYWSFLHPRLGVIARAAALRSGGVDKPTYGIYHFIRNAEGQRLFGGPVIVVGGGGGRGGTPPTGAPTAGAILSPQETALVNLYNRRFPIISGADDGPPRALDTLAKIRLALELADKTGLGEIGEAALRAIRDPTFIVSTLLILGFYVFLWLTPEPSGVTKVIAGALTIYLLYHFTVNDIIGFARAFIALTNACSAATGEAELRVAGDAFLTAAGPIGFDIILLVFFWGLSRGVAPRVRAGAVRRAIARADADVAAAQARPGSGTPVPTPETPSRLVPDARATAADPANATSVLDALRAQLPEAARRGLDAKRAEFRRGGRSGRAVDPTQADARLLGILEGMKADPLRQLVEWGVSPEEAAAAQAELLAALARAARLRLIELDVVRDPQVRSKTAEEARGERTAAQAARDAAVDAVQRLLAELLRTRPELRDRLAGARIEDVAATVAEAVSRAELSAKWNALRLPGGVRIFQGLRIARRVPGFASIEAWMRAHPGESGSSLAFFRGELYRVLGEVDTLVAARSGGAGGRLRVLELEETKSGGESSNVAAQQLAGAFEVLRQIGTGAGENAGARVFEGGTPRALGNDVTTSFDLADLSAVVQSTRGPLGRPGYTAQLPFDTATLRDVVTGYLRDGFPARPQTVLPPTAPRDGDGDGGAADPLDGGTLPGGVRDRDLPPGDRLDAGVPDAGPRDAGADERPSGGVPDSELR